MVEEGVEKMESEKANARGDVSRVLHALFSQGNHRGSVVGGGEEPDEERGELESEEAVDDGGLVLDEEEGDAEKRLGRVLAKMVEEETEIVGLDDDVEERVCEREGERRDVLSERVQ